VRVSFRRLKNILLHNWWLKLMSAVLAALTFFVIRGKTGVEVPYEVPLEVRFDEKGIAILDQDIRKVRVNFRGSQEDLRRIEQQKLKAVVQPTVSNVAGSERVPITVRNITGVPGGVRAVSVRPETVALTFDREVSKEVPVSKPTTIGMPLVGKVSLDYEPKTVTIRGPKRRLEDQHRLPTEPVDVDGRVASFTKTVRVLPPGDAWVSEIEPSEITVSVDITTESVNRQWTNILVLAVLDPDTDLKVKFEPAQVNVSLEGPAEKLEDMAQESILVFVDTAGLESEGEYELPVRVHVPAGADLTSVVEPRTVRVFVTSR